MIQPKNKREPGYPNWGGAREESQLIKKYADQWCTDNGYRITDHELRSWKHKFLKRLDHYNELIFDEKERAKVDSNALLKEFEDDGRH